MFCLFEWRKTLVSWSSDKSLSGLASLSLTLTGLRWYHALDINERHWFSLEWHEHWSPSRVHWTILSAYSESWLDVTWSNLFFPHDVSPTRTWRRRNVFVRSLSTESFYAGQLNLTEMSTSSKRASNHRVDCGHLLFDHTNDRVPSKQEKMSDRALTLLFALKGTVCRIVSGA